MKESVVPRHLDFDLVADGERVGLLSRMIEPGTKRERLFEDVRMPKPIERQA